MHTVKRWVVDLGVIIAATLGLAVSVAVVANGSTGDSIQVVQAKTTHRSKSRRVKSNQQLAKLKYNGTQTIDVNGGKPTFSAATMSTDKGGWQHYGQLDRLNRATDAEAMLNRSLMPTAAREPLNVDPTGWHNKRIRSGYLYNRSHLIGYQLTGQNNNWSNLMTGTRSLNSPEMLRFEDDIANYLKQSDGNYIRYSVVPVFKGDNLLASGVHMMAQSVGNNSVSFNVYIFNVEDGVTLNYADGTSTVSAAATSSQQQTPVVTSSSQAPDANTNQQGDNRTVYVTPSGSKYHFDPHCRGLRAAKQVESIPLGQAKAEGYTLCAWEQ